MIGLLLFMLAAFLLQYLFSFFQIRHFTQEYIALRKKGKVACGRQAGGFRAGAIVLFRVDDDGIIQEGRKLEGITCLARIKTLNGYDGKYIGTLTAEDLPRKSNKNLRKAVLDAAFSYNKFMAGEEIETPPTPLGRVSRGFHSLLLGKRTT